jgi:predicted dehydrogenase
MTSPAAPLRVGIVGFGLAGKYFHAPFIASVAGLDLAAIVTNSAQRVSEAHALYPRARVVASVDELLALADVDIVVVATPNRPHYEIALRSIRHGRHVVIDKPMTTSVREAEALIRAAERAQVVLSVFQNRRWDGDFLTLRSLLERGAVGPVDSFEARFEVQTRGVRLGWRERAIEAGGPLRDLGPHLVDQAVVLFGPVRQLWAQMDRRRPGSEVEDSVFIAIDHASGVRSRLWTSWIASRSGPRYRLRGRDGEYVKEFMDIQEEQLVAGMLPTTARYGREPRERWGRLHGADGAMTVVPTERGNYRSFYRMLAEAVRGTGPAPVDPRDAVHVQRVLDAAGRAAASGRVQTL